MPPKAPSRRRADLDQQLRGQVTAALDALGDGETPPVSSPDEFAVGLLKPRVPQVANSLHLRRDLGTAFAKGADTAPQVLLSFARS
jgi:hypothetical protein